MIKDILIYLAVMIILVGIADRLDPMTSFIVATGAFVWLIMETVGRWRP